MRVAAFVTRWIVAPATQTRRTHPVPAATRPTRGLRWPRRIRGRSRVPGRRRSHRGCRSRRRRRSVQLLAGNPGPAIDHAEDQLPPGSTGPNDDRLVGRRVAKRVFDQVHEHALSLGGVDLDRGQVGRDVGGDPIAARAEGRHRLRDQPVGRPQLLHRSGGAGLQPGQVEQVRHQPDQSVGLDRDRVEQALAIGLGEVEPAVRETLGRSADSGQRRAEVVAYGAQHGGLGGVAAPQRLGLERLLGERLAIDSHRQQRCQRRQEALPHGDVRLGVVVDVERAHLTPADRQRQRRLPLRRWVRPAKLDPRL
jgi:hypothetical protein